MGKQKEPCLYDQDPFTRTLYENEKINSLINYTVNLLPNTRQRKLLL